MLNNEYDKLIRELNLYENEHKDLDSLLHRAAFDSSLDQLAIQRMKKRKLWLKDQISSIKAILYPDIIA